MLGRVLYGAAFMLALPAMLVAWAIATHHAVELPAPRWPLLGGGLAFVGAALMAAGMWGLWKRGGGLPMNAFPPRRFVFSGVYRLVPDPIYVGFGLACFGVSLVFGSASGLWLVSPVAVLGAAALVYGYERDAVRARFGPPPGQTLLRIPRNESTDPNLWDRLSAIVLVMAPWAILYEAIGHLTVPGAIDSRFAFERGWPVWTWTTPIYSTAYPFVFLMPWVVASKSALRKFCAVALVGTAFGMLFYIALPVISPPRPFDEAGSFAWLLRLERADGLDGRNALPAFHVFWVMAAAAAWASRGRAWATAGWLCCAAISTSCITTGMHAVLDLVGGALLFAAAAGSGAAWRSLVRAAERIANSWREWRIGPIRVINHALYAGAAAAPGMVIAACLAGVEHARAFAIVALFSLTGAALWGQLLVGSKTLLRPFGYFGAILGAALGLGVAAWMREPTWILAGALAAAGPWVVAIGRMRCLVQGCCHGRPVESAPGIRYRHPKSRVCRIAHLDGVGVHPTPVYSMASSVVLGLLLLRLWLVGTPLSMITGLYLIGAGMTRFVEEHFRGEPQTQIVGGLRMYQWFAAASVLAGIAVSCLPSPTASAAIAWDWWVALHAAAVGVMFALAMGVDFPESDRRYSRLV